MLLFYFYPEEEGGMFLRSVGTHIRLYTVCYLFTYGSFKQLCIASNVRMVGPPLWSSDQSFWIQIQRSRVRFLSLPDFLRSTGSGTGSTQPREDN
jgi:hypothetical protein